MEPDFEMGSDSYPSFGQIFKSEGASLLHLRNLYAHCSTFNWVVGTKMDTCTLTPGCTYKWGCSFCWCKLQLQKGKPALSSEKLPFWKCLSNADTWETVGRTGIGLSSLVYSKALLHWRTQKSGMRDFSALFWRGRCDNFLIKRGNISKVNNLEKTTNFYFEEIPIISKEGHKLNFSPFQVTDKQRTIQNGLVC